MLSQCARFHLKTDEAAAIIDAMEKTVKASWYEIARREGVTETDCSTISGAFAYPGFRHGLDQVGDDLTPQGQSPQPRHSLRLRDGTECPVLTRNDRQ